MDLFDYAPPAQYPDAPGHRRTDTSRDAARSVEAGASLLQRRVLSAIKEAGEHGLTMEECADAVGVGRHSVQPRTSELRAKRLIVDSGQRRALASGRRGIVWRAA